MGLRPALIWRGAKCSDILTKKVNPAKESSPREWTKKELKRLGFTFGDSKTNFIFAKHETVHANEIFTKLREKHIYVRHFNDERIDNYLRISIGTQEEMEYFISEVEKLV